MDLGNIAPYSVTLVSVRIALAQRRRLTLFILLRRKTEGHRKRLTRFVRGSGGDEREVLSFTGKFCKKRDTGHLSKRAHCNLKFESEDGSNNNWTIKTHKWCFISWGRARLLSTAPLRENYKTERGLKIVWRWSLSDVCTCNITKATLAKK